MQRVWWGNSLDPFDWFPRSSLIHLPIYSSLSCLGVPILRNYDFVSSAVPGLIILSSFHLLVAFLYKPNEHIWLVWFHLKQWNQRRIINLKFSIMICMSCVLLWVETFLIQQSIPQTSLGYDFEDLTHLPIPILSFLPIFQVKLSQWQSSKSKVLLPTQRIVLFYPLTI